MKKRVLNSIILIVTVFSIITLYSKNVGMDENVQINIFADKAAEWSKDYLSDPYPFYITVADLNKDGRLELITAGIEGTGKYSQNRYYVVDEESSTVIKLQEYPAERLKSPDLIYDVIYQEKESVDVPVYYDKKNNRFYSIHRDFCRMTSQELTEAVVSVSMNRDVIEEQYMAYKNFEHDSEGDIPAISYRDYSGNRLSEEEYKAIEGCTYSGMQKKKMTWKWQKVTGSQIANMEQYEVYKVLKDIYSSFKIVDE